MNPLIFLIDIVFQLYAGVLLIRLLLQWVRADFYNPISQFVVKITNPVVKPLRRVIPGYGGIDLATLLLAILVIAIKVMLVYQTLNPLVIGLLAVGQTLILILSIFLYSVIIHAILSWINPDPYNPVMTLLSSLSRPVSEPFRKLIPPMGGMDISPIFAIIALMFVQYTIRYLFFSLLGISL